MPISSPTPFANKLVAEDEISGLQFRLMASDGVSDGLAALGVAIANQFTGVASVNAIGKVTTAATLKNGWNSLTLTHAQACALTMPTATFIGQKCKLLATQDTTSSYNGTITHTGVKIAGGSLPTMTATSGALDLYEYTWSGTVWIMTDADQAIA